MVGKHINTDMKILLYLKILYNVPSVPIIHLLDTELRMLSKYIIFSNTDTW